MSQLDLFPLPARPAKGFVRKDICKRGHKLSETRVFRKRGHADCCECWKIRSKERYQLHKKKIQAYQRHWAKNVNPAAAQRSRWRNHLKKTYGITPAIWDTMLERQNGGCGICGAEPGKRRFHVDHNHVTGEIRALLCDNCNHAVGCLRESPIIAEKVLAYLRKHSQLRVVTNYKNTGVGR